MNTNQNVEKCTCHKNLLVFSKEKLILLENDKDKRLSIKFKASTSYHHFLSFCVVDFTFFSSYFNFITVYNSNGLLLNELF